MKIVEWFDFISKENYLLKVKSDSDFGCLEIGKCLNICFVKCNRGLILLNKRIVK